MKKITLILALSFSLACKQNNIDSIYDSLKLELKNVDNSRYAISLEEYEFSNERIKKTLNALKAKEKFSGIIPSEINVSYSTNIDLTIPSDLTKYLIDNKNKSLIRLEVGYGMPIKLLDDYYCYFSYHHYYEGGETIKGGSEMVTILKFLPDNKWQVIETWSYLDI